jgi:hypothetical protein
MSVLKNNIIASLLADFSQKDNFIGMIALYVRNHAGYTFGGLSVFNKLYLSLLIICSFMYYAYSGFTEIKYEKDSLLFKTLSFALVSFYSLLNFALPVLTYRVSEYFLPVISVVLPNLSTRIKEKQIFFIVLSIYIFLLSYLLLTRTTSL